MAEPRIQYAETSVGVTNNWRLKEGNHDDCD